MNPFRATDLEKLFNQTFTETFNTVLAGGADEPLYQPDESGKNPHTIYYRADYFRSALHEIAHWCIAGEERRRQLDYGYWYQPDGRDHQQQLAFEQAECRPQALEWLFTESTGHDFRLSSDNLSADGCDLPSNPSQTFSLAVQQCALDWCQNGLPDRAARFINALQHFYGRHDSLSSRYYQQPPR